MIVIIIFICIVNFHRGANYMHTFHAEFMIQ